MYSSPNNIDAHDAISFAFFMFNEYSSVISSQACSTEVFRLSIHNIIIGRDRSHALRVRQGLAKIQKIIENINKPRLRCPGASCNILISPSMEQRIESANLLFLNFFNFIRIY